MPVISDTSDASANSDLSKKSALADLAWLVSDAARPWLERAAAESQVSVRFAQSLRKDLSAERARLVCELAELRRRAREKFSLAAEMFFTRRGFEQATDEWLASYKAARFAAGTRVVDFCCGVGGDLMALARRGPAIGVDRDEAMQVLARANLALVSHHRGEASPASEMPADVACADVESIELAEFDGWHADPDRRIEGRRATQIERLSPGVEVLERWIRAGRAGGVKLAPASDTPTSWRRDIECEWLGSRGECRQQMIWTGSAARHLGKNAATVCGGDGAVETVVDDAAGGSPLTDSVESGEFLFEPHAAVLAAGLEGTLARSMGWQELDGSRGFLVGSPPEPKVVPSPALAEASIPQPPSRNLLYQSYKILESLPFDRRRLKQWLRRRGAGRVVVKKRGVELEPARLSAELSGDGADELVVVVTRCGGQVIAIVAVG